MREESWEETGARLERELLRLRPEELADFFRREEAALLTEPRPFARYMRLKLREKGLLQQDVFLAADLSENYGYKLVAGEKHTRQRDTILRLCLAARFTPEELREALILYGMAPLYSRFPRDAALQSAFQNGLYELPKVDRLLRSLGLPPLMKDGET